MLVAHIWTENSLRNFNYLIACAETGEALAVDPLDHVRCLERARREGWEITQIVNTHEHGDHTGGNAAVVAATGAQVLAHWKAADRIRGGIDRGLRAGDVVRVGKTVELECLDTPGHTMSHVCLLAHGDSPAIFSGDTLFNAGAGNCHNGGHPEELYATFANQLARLSDATRVFPGHDYLANNLRFTLDREPDNAEAARMLAKYGLHDPNDPHVTTLGEEKEVNTFLRLRNPTVIARLREVFSELSPSPTPRDVFLRLRELRNRW
jgi:hydroxyacylglutathione hydrolase